MTVAPARRTRLAAGSLALALIATVTGASACSSDSAGPVVVSPSRPESPAVAPDGATQTPDGSRAPLRNVSVKLTPAWQGLEQPLYVTSARDGSGRVFIVEKTGRIRIARGKRLLDRPYLDLQKQVSGGGEQGLLGLAFAPDFAHTGRFYVNYTDVNGDTNVVRYEVADPAADVPRVTGRRTVLRIAQPYANHNGGCIAFGPEGYLYVGMGDGGSGGDPQNRAQNPKVLLGKMLRIDVGESLLSPDPATLTVPDTYRIPGDNPFAGPEHNEQGYRPEIWALGLRNPWRFSFDRSTGDLWIGDVGQNAWEEIDFAPSGQGGQNYGWRVFEGTHPYQSGSAAPPERGFTDPVVEYSHGAGQSVTGGYVYRGSDAPLLRGVYIYADYSSGRIWGIRYAGAKTENALLATTSLSIASFGEDESGELYVCDLGGSVYRVSARAR